MIYPPIKNQVVFKIIQTFSQFSVHGNVHMDGPAPIITHSVIVDKDLNVKTYMYSQE
ncbi:unnamed protein product [Acanthoscelides obtectus]|uniref:Uncharacterized protein n=1 Tax=Acanthoscelides obtectus TaxID=200917 RepID=A0A9P0JX04_ACAOB|nr:unnamed protein product [Acanthoscelides obtectus]CAK1663452.1 hypothetical protein AOBTE_LOCUS23670 [Acanthoscelides obtectus]